MRPAALSITRFARPVHYSRRRVGDLLQFRVNAYTDPIPVASAKSELSRKEAKRARRARDARDLGLLAKAGRGDQEAASQLAERLAPRTQRLARALMGGSVDADDAALHALTELLRSPASYRGKEPLERWADRKSAFAVMRFARAVTRRSGPSEAAVRRPRDERTARTFEQYLQALSDNARQALLLHHALGLTLAELADGLQCPVAVARQQLLAARAELRSLVRRRGGQPAVVGPGAGHWCAQRDREAVGQVLRADEQAELAQLEARDPEVWAFVAQVRALELYLDAPRSGPSAFQGGTLAARAVAALGVTRPASGDPKVVREVLRPARDLEGSRVVRWLAVGASFMLAFATAGALLVYRPPPRPSAATAQPTLISAPQAGSVASSGAASAAVAAGVQALAVGRWAPTVESLPSRASTAERGGRLRRAGRVLTPGTQLSRGDIVEAFERNGCLQIEPGTTVCLALGSAVRLVSLSSRDRELELSRGRAVVRMDPRLEPARLTLRAGALEVSAVRAAFGVERTFDGQIARARSLRGVVDARVGKRTETIDESTSALCRSAEDLVLVPSVAVAAQRDWEVLATGLRAAPARLPAAADTTLGQPALRLEEAEAHADSGSSALPVLEPAKPTLVYTEPSSADSQADLESPANTPEAAAFGGEVGEF